MAGSFVSTLSSLLPLAFTLCAYAVCLKLSAWLFRRTQLAWTHAGVFSLFVFVFGMAGTLLNLAAGRLIPIPVWLAVGLAAQLAFGGWYLRARATTAAGAPLGIAGAVLLSLGSYALVFLLGIAAAVLVPFLARMAVGQA